jgi:hypothetical protein
MQYMKLKTFSRGSLVEHVVENLSLHRCTQDLLRQLLAIVRSHFLFHQTREPRPPKTLLFSHDKNTMIEFRLLM